MDMYEGPARLEWWADRSTSLGGFGVHVTARAADGEWTCDAVLDGPLPEGRQEVFDALVQADPVLTLHFGEGGEILVDVVAAGDGARLVLTAHEPAAHALQG